MLVVFSILTGYSSVMSSMMSARVVVTGKHDLMCVKCCSQTCDVIHLAYYVHINVL